MTKLAQYCKAYYIKDMHAFPGWRGRAAQAAADASPTQSEGVASQHPDEAIVFLHHDFAVTRGIARDQDVLLEGNDPAWITYCREVLKFEVPDWCRQPIAQAS